jgi:pyruvate kinase
LLPEQFGTYFKVPNPATLMTKIICTIGPATDDPETLGRMMDAGMSAARINMSHGSHDYAAQCIDHVRQAAKTRCKLCPIILDTMGPEIRVSWLSNTSKSLQLNSQDHVVLLTGRYLEQPPNKPLPGLPDHQVAVSYPYLAKAVRQGDVVLLDDGRISLMVTRVSSEDAVCAQVIQGGTLLHNKGVNLPGCHVELPHLTEKDKQDILFGVQKKVEYIAHSFTRSATGINQVRELPGVVESGSTLLPRLNRKRVWTTLTPFCEYRTESWWHEETWEWKFRSNACVQYKNAWWPAAMPLANPSLWQPNYWIA